MSNTQKLDIACENLRKAIANERKEEIYAHLWAKALIENDSFQKRKLRALQNGGRK